MDAVAGNAEPWLRRAMTALAHTSATDTIPPDWSSSYALYVAAREHRAFVLGELAAIAVEAVGDVARWVRDRYRSGLRAAAVREALHQLDDRTLHDLGIDRSEIASVAAESTGEARGSLPHELRVRSVAGSRAR